MYTKNTVWILVNFNCQNEIHSLVAQFVNSVDFYIVDNSGDYKRFGEEIIFRPDVNLGYIGAFQFALQQLGSTVNNLRVIFSNSDIIVGNNVIPILEELKEGSVYFPRITNLDQKEQNPHLIKRPSLVKILLLYIFSSFSLTWILFTALYSNKKVSIPEVSSNDCIYAGHGSFMYFAKVSIYDISRESFNFLFGEEIHLAEYLSSKGISSYFIKNIQIIHKEHSTTDKLRTGKRARLYRDSYKKILNYYFR